MLVSEVDSWWAPTLLSIIVTVVVIIIITFSHLLQTETTQSPNQTIFYTESTPGVLTR